MASRSFIARLRVAFPVALLLLGVALAAPPAMRWSRRNQLARNGEHQWRAVEQQESLTPGNPVARLRIPGVGLQQNILDGATKENLELWPAIEQDDPLVVMAHRDTHFNALKHLEIGMLVEWRTREGISLYRVEDIEIHRPERVNTRLENLRQTDALILLSCYPFHFFGPAPQRYLAICRPSISERPVASTTW